MGGTGGTGQGSGGAGGPQAVGVAGNGGNGFPPGGGGGGAGNLGAASGAGADGRIIILAFNATPTITKAFAPTTIQSGGTSLVTLTLTNTNTTTLTGGAFTDTLANMSAVAGAVGGTCTGTTPNILTAGQTALSFSGITVPASGSCTVTFSVTSGTVGGQPNSTSGVTTTQTPTAGTGSNTATLTVTALTPPVVATPIPTLNQWMLAVLAGLLLVAGAVTVRRQR